MFLEFGYIRIMIKEFLLFGETLFLVCILVISRKYSLFVLKKRKNKNIIAVKTHECLGGLRPGDTAGAPQ